jgi:hypothetical protein
MRQVSYKTVERWPSGHHNPHENIVVQYGRHHEIELESGSGSDDDVYVYKDGEIGRASCRERVLSCV